MKKSTLIKTGTALIAATALLNTVPVMADAGDILVRVRALHINVDGDSSTVRAAGASVAGSGVGLDNDTIPELDITYMITRNIGAELILGWSSHNVDPQGTLPGVIGGSADIIKAKALPPTLTLQYHFMPDAAFRPYLGAGINYTNFFDEEVSGALAAAGANVKLRNSWGYALQAGFDYTLKDDWFVNFDVKYVDIDTTASFSGTALGAVPLHVDVDVDPILIGIGIGKRF